MRQLTWVLLMSLVCFAASCTSGDSSTTATDADKTVETTTVPDADNTAKNLDPAADATYQSENQADIQISSEIRKAVVADDKLSVNAHNVKIMTANGVVTLRGPVKNEQEKSTIEAKAKGVAGVSKVDNLLEVERNP